jgi:hypothetical protein
MEAMRHTTRALVGIILVACGSPYLAAAETGSRWWPFDRKEEAKLTQQSPAAGTSAYSPMPSTGAVAAPSGAMTPASGTQYGAMGQAPVTSPPAGAATSPSTTPETASKENWMLSSRGSKIGWPRLNRPKTGIFAAKPDADKTRNSWVEQTPAQPKPSPFKPITDGAKKVSKNTKEAWHKTVHALTPGESETPRSSSSRVAKRDAKPSMWQRMFATEPEKGSETIPEFMAQQRLNP